jgi:hypothetical protein
MYRFQLIGLRGSAVLIPLGSGLQNAPLLLLK